MNKIEFLKEWFYKEEERKGTLNDSLNIPIGILTGIVAVVYFVLSNYNYENGSKLLKFLFIILIIVCIFFWLRCIFYLLLSYNNFHRGYGYKAFPSADFIKKEYETLTPYYKEYKSEFEETGVTLDKLVENNIEEILVQCIDNNVFNNDKKSGYLHNSKTSIIICILSLFFSSIIFSINYINYKQEEILCVKIINQMSDKRTPPPPPRPQEPRVIKENQQPVRPDSRPTPPSRSVPPKK